MESYLSNGLHGYAHMLGFRKDCADVLSIIKQQSSVLLLSKLTDVSGLDDIYQRMLSQDIFASDLYETVITDKFKTPFINEYEHSIIRV